MFLQKQKRGDGSWTLHVACALGPPAVVDVGLSVKEAVEQVKDVLPALHEKSKVYQKEGTMTGFTAGLEGFALLQR